jgi:hypothetical protein
VRRAGRHERALLVECLLSAAAPRRTLAELASRVHGDAFVELARSFAVSETAGHALLSTGSLHLLAPGAARALREDAENAAAKNTLLVRDAAMLQRALADAGIPSVVLKGTALVAAHYPAVGARHVGDLDLLVMPAAVERAAAVLTGLGCDEDRPALRWYDGGAAPQGDHHLVPRRTPGGIACELHFDLPGGYGEAARVEGVLARSREVRLGNFAVRVPSPEDLFGIACVHALGAHRSDHRFVPRHLADLAVLVASGADIEAATRLYPRRELTESSELLAAARAHRTEVALGRSVSRRVERVALRARNLAERMRKAKARRSLARMFFPRTAFMAERYGIPPSSPAFPLLYVWRPLRVALRVATGR